MAQNTVLIIEDDEDIREGIRILLEGEQYHVREAASGLAGLALVREDVDVVILDIMMPGMSGLRVCEEIRKVSNVPVLFLTAKSQESDKLIGLMAGGDDYLTKPFSYAELLGRIKALTRRYNVYRGRAASADAAEQDTVLERSGIRIHLHFNEVTVDGQEKHLSDKEYQILLLLMQHPGRVFSAKNLYELVWGEPFYYSSNNTVMVHVRKLRTKIEPDPQNPTYVRTVWGKGYYFEKTT
jgi:DNA-binding response OmpR family regulator